jgi:hypothetical protein
MDPAAALLDALWSACADVAELDRLLSEHDAGQGELWVHTMHLTGQLTGEARRIELIRMREDARKAQADFAASCLRAKVAEEQVRAAQTMGAAVAESHRALASLLGHSTADPKVKQAMRAALAPLAGSSTASHV